MPIKRIEEAAARLPRIGQLWKGGPRKEKNGKLIFGDDLQDCFRFTSDDPLLQEKFKEVFGERPKSIPFRLYYPTAAENFDYWQEEWASGGGLLHRCDGDSCVLWWDAKQKAYREDAKPCPGNCKAVGRLHLFISDLGRWGIVTLTTHSIYDVLNLQRNFKSIHDDFGNVRGMPLVLRRVEDDVYYVKDDGTRAKARKWLLLLEVDPQLASVKLAEMERRFQAMLGAPAPPLELPAGTFPEDEAESGDGVPEGIDPMTGELTEPVEVASPVAAPAPAPLPPPSPAPTQGNGKPKAADALRSFLFSKHGERAARAAAAEQFGRDIGSLSLQELQRLRDAMTKREPAEGLFESPGAGKHPVEAGH